MVATVDDSVGARRLPPGIASTRFITANGRPYSRPHPEPAPARDVQARRGWSDSRPQARDRECAQAGANQEAIALVRLAAFGAIDIDGYALAGELRKMPHPPGIISGDLVISLRMCGGAQAMYRQAHSIADE